MISFSKPTKADRSTVNKTLNRFNLKRVNSPVKTPSHPTKSHLVLAYDGKKYKLIRFGQQGVIGIMGFPKSKRRSVRSNFRKRHKKNISKGILFPAFWSNKVKW